MSTMHPDSSSREERLGAAVFACVQALEAGQPLGEAEIRALYPDLADDLLRYLDGRREVEQVAAPLRQAVQAGPEAPPGEEVTGPGRVLGDFRLLREVGRGGMGIVYEAEQVSLRRRVAVKVLPLAATLDPRALQRFQNEARAAAGLHHTHIVPVHFVGCERGVHFYAMQFIDGRSLAEMLRELRQPGTGSPEEQTTVYDPAGGGGAAATVPEARRTSATGGGAKTGREYFRRVAEWGVQAAEALDHAHGLGVVHRDVKPANLLVDGRGCLWVTDFGLAQMQQSEGSLTRTGDLVGTLRYMSPEQALAKRVPIDHRTDVYSLGATLYELLTLRPAFGGSDRQELLRQIAFDEPRPPRRLNRSVPAELAVIVLKALEKAAQDRYATAQELADDLRRWLDDRPIQAKRPSWLRRAARWARRHRAAAVAVFCLLVAVACAATAAASLDLYRAAQNAHELAAQNRRISARLDSHHLWQMGLDDEIAGRLEDARDHLVQALEILDREPEADAGDRRHIEEDRDRVVGRLTLVAGRTDLKARQDGFGLYQSEVRVHEIHFTEGSREADWAAIRRAAPAALARFGLSADDSPADAARRLEVFRPYAEPRQLEDVAADCYQVLLAWAEAEAPPGAKGAAGARRALHLLDLAAALGAAQHLPTPAAYHLHRDRYLALAGDQAAARAEQQQAAVKPGTVLDLFQGALESYQQKKIAQGAAACAQVLDREPNHFWALYLEALCHLRTRRWDLAKGEFTACLSQRPGFFWARLLRATAESQLDEFQAAGDDFAQVLPRAEEPAARWVALTNRGVLWLRRERWDEAIADFRQAVALQPDSSESYIDLAEAYRRRGDWKPAVAALDKALARRPPDAAGLYHTRAVLDLDRRDFATARHDFEQAIALCPAGATSERLASDCVELGHLRHQAGEHEAALALFDKALQAWPDYPPAYLQRAETLLALGRYEDAGKALDRYLLKGTPTAKVYRVRGLIHAALRRDAEAVDACSRSLALEPDADTLAYRGWAYLRLDAFRPALADFDAALRLNPAQRDALCGRGYAQVRLGRLTEAVADAEASVGHGRPAPLLLFAAARVYAVAVGEVQARAGGRWLPGSTASQYQERAVDLLRLALDAVPAAKRQDFWRDNVRSAADLAPVRGSTSFLELARNYRR